MPNYSTIAKLILYIVYELNELGRSPSTIQLVKYLYLIDIEHQRRFRKPLTELRWVFYKYGPYAFEFKDITEGLGFDLTVETFTTEGGEGRSYKTETEVPFPPELRSYSQSVVDNVLKKWAFVTTKELLDYVYFHTEPMIDAKRGDILDFSLVEPEDVGAYQIVFRDTKMLRELRARHEKPLQRTGRVRQVLTESPDDLFFDVMNKLDNEEG